MNEINEWMNEWAALFPVLKEEGNYTRAHEHKHTFWSKLHTSTRTRWKNQPRSDRKINRHNLKINRPNFKIRFFTQQRILIPMDEMVQKVSNKYCTEITECSSHEGFDMYKQFPPDTPKSSLQRNFLRHDGPDINRETGFHPHSAVVILGNTPNVA